MKPKEEEEGSSWGRTGMADRVTGEPDWQWKELEGCRVGCLGEPDKKEFLRESVFLNCGEMSMDETDMAACESINLTACPWTFN